MVNLKTNKIQVFKIDFQLLLPFGMKSLLVGGYNPLFVFKVKC